MEGVNIEDFIPFGHENAVKRSDLKLLLGISDRRMREEIEGAKFRNVLICNLSDGKGYFRPLASESDLIRRCYEIERHRALNILCKTSLMKTALADIGRGVWKDSSS